MLQSDYTQSSIAFPESPEKYGGPYFTEREGITDRAEFNVKYTDTPLWS